MPREDSKVQRASPTASSSFHPATRRVSSTRRTALMMRGVGSATSATPSVAIAVKDAAMRADFNDVELYQGRGKGSVTLDGSAGSANLAANVTNGA